MIEADPFAANALRNFQAWWQIHGVVTPPVQFVSSSRIYYQRTPEFVAAIEQLCASSVLAKAEAGNHGMSSEQGYREEVSGCSAQIIVHTWFVEMDFDLHNPWDVVGVLGHLFGEVLPNKIRKKATDPEIVAQALRKRGFDV